MKHCGLLLVSLVLGACSGTPKPLEVKQFQLRDVREDRGTDPMVRNEKLRRLHGAVSVEERRQRLGQYYTILWRDETGAGEGVPEIVFEYQQGGTGSRIRTFRSTFESSAPTGIAEFAVTGDNYFENGRVLAWRATFRRGGRTIATRQSYLWQ